MIKSILSYHFFCLFTSRDSINPDQLPQFTPGYQARKGPRKKLYKKLHFLQKYCIYLQRPPGINPSIRRKILIINKLTL